MKESFFSLLTSTSTFSWMEVIVRIVVSAIFGLFIFVTYYLEHSGTIYSKRFNVSLALLTVMTGTVMTVIGNNIALSLGMVGALSIVRFRTAIKDSRDTVYIFWTIIAGICCGVGDYKVASVGSFVIFVLILFLGALKTDNRMLLIVRAEAKAEEAIISEVDRLFNSKAKLRVRNTSPDSIEFIYEITEEILKTAEKSFGSVTVALNKLDGTEYANLVMQNDEISN